MAGIALPILVLSSTGEPVAAGVVALATGISTVLSGVLSASAIDRFDKRRTAAVGDVVSAVGVGIVAVACLMGQAPVWVFVVGAFVGGLGDMPAWNSREAMAYSVARAAGSELDTVVGIRESVSGLAIVLGPTLAGVLMGVFDARVVLAVTVATSLAAAALVALGPVAKNGGAAELSKVSDLGGLRGALAMLRTPRFFVLRRIIGLNVASVAVVGVLQGLLLPVVFALSGQEGMAGYALACIGIGLLAGGGIYVAAREAARRLSVIVVSVVVNCLCLLGVAAVGASWLTLALCAGFGLTSSIVGARIGVLSLNLSPESHRGRINGLQNTLSMVVTPVAVFGVALIVSHTSVWTASVGLVVLWAVANLVFLLSREVRKALAGVPGESATMAS